MWKRRKRNDPRRGSDNINPTALLFRKFGVNMEYMSHSERLLPGLGGNPNSAQVLTAAWLFVQIWIHCYSPQTEWSSCQSISRQKMDMWLGRCYRLSSCPVVHSEHSTYIPWQKTSNGGFNAQNTFFPVDKRILEESINHTAGPVKKECAIDRFRWCPGITFLGNLLLFSNDLLIEGHM